MRDRIDRLLEQAAWLQRLSRGIPATRRTEDGLARLRPKMFRNRQQPISMRPWQPLQPGLAGIQAINAVLYLPSASVYHHALSWRRSLPVAPSCRNTTKNTAIAGGRKLYGEGHRAKRVPTIPLRHSARENCTHFALDHFFNLIAKWRWRFRITARKRR